MSITDSKRLDFGRGGAVFTVTLFRGQDSRDPRPADFWTVNIVASNSLHARLLARDLYGGTALEAHKVSP